MSCISLRYLNFVLITFPMVFCATASAVTIENVYTGTDHYTDAPTSKVNFYPRTIDVGFVPDSGEALPETCLTVTGTVGLKDTGFSIKIPSWGSYSTPSWNSVGYGVIDLTLKNACGYDISGTINVKIYRPDNSAKFSSHRNIASSECSVDVNPGVNFPDMLPGDKGATVNVTSAGKGAGSVTFKPDAHDETGGLLKGDNGGTLKYSVTGETSNPAWNSAGQWSGSVNNDYAVKLEDVPSSTTPGNYKGIMSAAVTCS